jgi:hypothetical protein
MYSFAPAYVVVYLENVPFLRETTRMFLKKRDGDGPTRFSLRGKPQLLAAEKPRTLASLVRGFLLCSTLCWICYH